MHWPEMVECCRNNSIFFENSTLYLCVQTSHLQNVWTDFKNKAFTRSGSGFTREWVLFFISTVVDVAKFTHVTSGKWCNIPTPVLLQFAALLSKHEDSVVWCVQAVFCSWVHGQQSAIGSSSARTSSEHGPVCMDRYFYCTHFVVL